MRYFLDSDDDGHWYLVPCDRRAEWFEWHEIPSDDEPSWDVPEFAYRLNGSPNEVAFENPIVDGALVKESD